MAVSSNPSLDLALAFARNGFPIFSVWGIKDGVCLCPKGKLCDTPGKHPVAFDGFKAATVDEERIRTMLSAPGSAGNYGIVPFGHMVILDADGEGYIEKLRELGLPQTLTNQTANGVHLYFYWPDEYGPPPTKLFGWIVRSVTHLGYAIGPGSTHVSGKTYKLRRVNGEDFIGLVNFIGHAIREFPADKVPTPQLGITVSGPRDPRTVEVGGRHPHLVKTARYLFGIGLTGEALFEAVWQVNLRFPEPKTEAEVRRAIGEVETKFEPDPVPLTPEEAVAAATNLIVSLTDYRTANSAVPEWVSPLAAYGHVSLVSGPPKSGKSTLIGNLMRAREDGTVFLWGDPVPTGPMLLVTEEGGYPIVRKLEGLTTPYILDRMAFVMAGLKSLDHLLAALTVWVQQQESNPLVIIDTLAVWGDIEDENDSVAATKSVNALQVWAQMTLSALVLVHHTRKGGGEHGEAVRGSGAIFATVDQSVELAYGLDPRADARQLSTVGRLAYGESKTLEFDRDTLTYSVSTAPIVDEFPLDDFPMDGSGTDGFTREDAEKAWDVATGTANKRLKLLVGQKRLVKRMVRLPGERTDRGVYWRARPLLVVDNRSVGERMSDIFHPGSDDE